MRFSPIPTSAPLSRLTANLLLLLTAAVWGAAFVSQSTAMERLSALWFIALRFVLSGIVVAPLAFREARQATTAFPARELPMLAGLMVVFVAGVVLQQQGIIRTTVSNAGFLTSLYVLATPFVALWLLREPLKLRDLIGAALALVGAYLMAGGATGLNAIGLGDLLVAASALAWGIQIVLMEIAVKRTGRPFYVVFAQYAVCATVAAGVALAIDPIDWDAIHATWPEVAYSGIVSGGVGYTLQAVAQRHTRSSDAAIIFAMEAPFAALFGAALLGERLGLVGWIGSALIFAAVLIVALWPAGRPPEAEVAEREGARG